MRFYFVVVLTMGIIWVPATVCAILAGIQGTAHMFVAWAIIAVTSFASCRLAGSKLREELDRHDRQEE